MSEPTILIIPGLRDHVDAHWQTLLSRELEARGRPVCTVPPMGREDLDCARRVDAIDRALASKSPEPPIVVAHSGGVIMFARWARTHRWPIRAALLATPPDFEQGSDTRKTADLRKALRAGGWLPVPREPAAVPQHRRRRELATIRSRGSSAWPKWRTRGAVASTISAKSGT